MTVENPFLKPVLILSKWEIPVLCRLLHKSVSRIVLVRWVDKLVWRKGSATLLALVAVSALSSTSWTGTYDVTVGKELTSNLVAILLFYDLLKLAVIVELTEEIRSELMMSLACCARIYIE